MHTSQPELIVIILQRLKQCFTDQLMHARGWMNFIKENKLIEICSQNYSLDEQLKVCGLKQGSVELVNPNLSAFFSSLLKNLNRSNSTMFNSFSSPL